MSDAPTAKPAINPAYACGVEFRRAGVDLEPELAVWRSLMTTPSTFRGVRFYIHEPVSWVTKNGRTLLCVFSSADGPVVTADITDLIRKMAAILPPRDGDPR